MTTTTATMTPDQARAACDVGLHTMTTARWFMMEIIQNLTFEQWMHQPKSGMNHVMFNVGHIAYYEGVFLRAAGGRTSAIPESWKEQFDMGCEPSAKASDYPSPKEVTEALTRVREDLMTHFKSLSGAQLLGPLGDGMNSDMTPTIAHVPAFITLHEGTHIGQILSIRQALKLPGVLSK